MKVKRRKYGIVSKVKHTVSNKKSEWDQDRKETKAMKVKADEVGKQRAKSAKKKQMERDAEEKYRQKYGLGSKSKPKRKTKSKRISPPRSPSTKKVKEYDPFGWQDL